MMKNLAWCIRMYNRFEVGNPSIGFRFSVGYGVGAGSASVDAAAAAFSVVFFEKPSA